jgi:hypothetical protein
MNALLSAGLLGLTGALGGFVTAQQPGLQGELPMQATWQGQVRLDGDVTVPKGGRLVIALGTAVTVAARDRSRAGFHPDRVEPASRLVELADGRIGYALKKRWRDGTTAVVMTKAVLMERLCALVPKPRKHLVTYHGVLAPASGLRPKVVPRRVEEEGEAGGCRHGGAGGAAGAESAEGVAADGGDGVENVAVAALLRQQAERRVRARLRVPHGGGRRRGGRRRYSWAELLQRALPRPSFSGLLRRPGRQRTQRRAAHVRDRGAGVPEVLWGSAGAGGDPRARVDCARAGGDGAGLGGDGAGGLPFAAGGRRGRLRRRGCCGVVVP